MGSGAGRDHRPHLPDDSEPLSTIGRKQVRRLLMDWLRAIKEDIKNATVLRLPRPEGGYYDYIVNSLSSGVPEIPSEALWGCAFEIARISDLRGVSKVIAPEAMGIHVASALSMVTGIPMLVVRKRRYGLPGEIEIRKRTGYEETRMYANGLGVGDVVLLVDSIIATGGTFVAIIKALEARGIRVREAVAVIERAELNGVERVRRETGHEVKTLIRVTVSRDRPVILG